MSDPYNTLTSTNTVVNSQPQPKTHKMYQQLPYLPDNVIENILSFLPIKDAARATTISKQWSALWPCFLSIDLDEGGDPTNNDKHLRFRCFLLLSLGRCRWYQKLLDKLRIRGRFDPGYDQTLVGRWVDFAVQTCVKDLHIQLLGTSYYRVPANVLTLQSLVSLSLENVWMYASSATVSLPSLKTMSLTEVLFMDDQPDPADWTIPSLVSGCPRLEHLSIHHRGLLGYNSHQLDISSDSLKSLEIINCCSKRVEVTAKSLESFAFDSNNCTCDYHGSVCLWECDSLKHVHIYCQGLKHLVMHSCLQTMENSFCTPNLETFEFSGNLNTKVHFGEAPSNLVKTTISVWETVWPVEFYSAMIDFLRRLGCSKEVEMHLYEAEGVIIPEHCRTKWSPPLPNIKQLQLYFSYPLGDREYSLRSSLIWMAPSAEILPFLIYNYEYDDFEYYDDNVIDGDNDEYDDFEYYDDNVIDGDNDDDDENENVDE